MYFYKFVTFLVAIVCIHHNLVVYFFLWVGPYNFCIFKLCLIIEVIIFLHIIRKIWKIWKWKAIRILLSIIIMSPNILSKCCSGDKLYFITTSKSFSYFFLYIILSPNIIFISVFPNYNTRYFLALNSIFHVITYKQTCNCLFLLSCHLHILKPLSVL